jgi:hypothetical protein
MWYWLTRIAENVLKEQVYCAEVNTSIQGLEKKGQWLEEQQRAGKKVRTKRNREKKVHFHRYFLMCFLSVVPGIKDS